MTAEPIVQMHRITVTKGNKRILKDVSLSIDRGEKVAILGPNGSGKSSLIKVMMGEYRHDWTREDASVRILGTDCWDMREVHAAFGLVSGDLQIDFMREIDGLEAVLSGFYGSVGINRSQDIDDDMVRKAMKALKTVQATRLAKKDVSIMSMGEARRVLMARALVNDPEALILDEPMNNLDLNGRHYVRKAMSATAKAGKAIVLITQDPSDIIPEIQRVIMVRKGQIFKDISIDELNEDDLSGLYQVPIKLVKQNGRYFAWS